MTDATHPPPAAAPASRPSKPATSAALAALLEPGLRLALSAGLAYADVDDVVRRLLVQLAPQLLRDTNTSQIAVITGLNRKEVQRLVGQGAAAPGDTSEGEPGAATPRKLSVASQLFLHWVAQLEAHPEWESLPLSEQPLAEPPSAPMSFMQLVRSATSDVHPRAVLDELLRLGLVAEQGGVVQLLVRSFVPSPDSDARLGLMIENVADHLRGGLQNVGGGAPLQLEQALWGEGLSLASCRALDAAARSAWEQAHRDMYAQLLAAPEAEPGVPRFRFKVGMYTHASPMPAVAATAEQLEKPTKKRGPR